MKRPLAPVCSFCLAASALVYQLPSQAQGVCYFVDASGQTINLDDLCESSSRSSSTSATSAPQLNTDAPTEAGVEVESSTPEITRTTITITGTSADRLDSETTTEAEASLSESEAATPANPTTFISGPGQPVGGGAVMTNSDPRLISQPVRQNPVVTEPSEMTAP